MPDTLLKSFFPSVLVIDDKSYNVRVKRLTNRECDEYSTQFATYGDARPTDTSQTPAQKAELEEANRVWVRDVLTAYMKILPGQGLKARALGGDWSSDDDDSGHDVTRGGELLDLFGGRLDVVPQALALLLLENRVPQKKKETLRSGLVSMLGLLANPSAEPGNSPAPTVAGAEPPIFVDPVAATAPLSDESSGTMDPSS